jgi:hypothetical protein
MLSSVMSCYFFKWRDVFLIPTIARLSGLEFLKYLESGSVQGRMTWGIQGGNKKAAGCLPCGWPPSGHRVVGHGGY